MSNLIKEVRGFFFTCKNCPLLCSSAAKQFGDVRFMDGCLHWLMFSVCLSAATAICLCSGTMVINQHPLRIFITARSRRHLRGLFALSQRVESHCRMFLFIKQHHMHTHWIGFYHTALVRIYFVSIQLPHLPSTPTTIKRSWDSVQLNSSASLQFLKHS